MSAFASDNLTGMDYLLWICLHLHVFNSSIAVFWSIVVGCMVDIIMLLSGQPSQISGMHPLRNPFSCTQIVM